MYKQFLLFLSPCRTDLERKKKDEKNIGYNIFIITFVVTRDKDRRSIQENHLQMIEAHPSSTLIKYINQLL